WILWRFAGPTGWWSVSRAFHLTASSPFGKGKQNKRRLGCRSWSLPMRIARWPGCDAGLARTNPVFQPLRSAPDAGSKSARWRTRAEEKIAGPHLSDTVDILETNSAGTRSRGSQPASFDNGPVGRAPELPRYGGRRFG